mmetsp:Transcript_20112/g.57070  ORF Transcript_20112/g.57070 Transcript_20112/m.57070 type:complete len:245 (+) Transcript_20112:263-997(+)
MVRERKPGREAFLNDIDGRLGVDVMLRDHEIAAQNGLHGLQTSVVVTHQALQTTESNAGEDSQILERWRLALGGCSDGDEPVKVVEDRVWCPYFSSGSSERHDVFDHARMRLVVREDDWLAIRVGPAEQPVLRCAVVQAGSQLAETLEFVHEFVEDVECPFRENEEFVRSIREGKILGIVQDLVEELTVHIPPIDVISQHRAVDPVPVAVRQLAVEGEEQRISVAFVDDGLRGWPRGSAEVLVA